MDPFSTVTPNDFPDNEDGTSNDDVESGEAKTEVSFDPLFGDLAEIMPTFMWALAMGALGKKDEQPSAKAQAKMITGWKKFAEAFGVKYVGKSVDIQLTSRWWLLAIPIFSTLVAIITDLGLSGLLPTDKPPTP